MATKKKPTKKATAKKKAVKPRAPRKKKMITNMVVVDASGSMNKKKAEVIGGLKELFKQIREDAERDKDTVITRTVVLDFSSAGDIRTLADVKDSALLDDKLADDYDTRGMTALFDAIGKGFSMIEKDQDGVFVSIITDGEENDSKEFTKEQITSLIEQAKKDLWAVTFMGTTEASINNAKSFGVGAGNVMRFADNGEGVARTMKVASLSRASYYASSVSGDLEKKQKASKDLLKQVQKEDEKSK